jgi:hypothetical protein
MKSHGENQERMCLRIHKLRRESWVAQSKVVLSSYSIFFWARNAVRFSWFLNYYCSFSPHVTYTRIDELWSGSPKVMEPRDMPETCMSDEGQCYIALLSFGCCCGGRWLRFIQLLFCWVLNGCCSCHSLSEPRRCWLFVFDIITSSDFPRRWMHSTCGCRDLARHQWP